MGMVNEDGLGVESWLTVRGGGGGGGGGVELLDEDWLSEGLKSWD